MKWSELSLVDASAVLNEGELDGDRVGEENVGVNDGESVGEENVGVNDGESVGDSVFKILNSVLL